MRKTDLISILNKTFTPFGFKKIGAFWKKEGDSISKIIFLQKSRFGSSFYINYGYIINSIPLDNLAVHVFKGLGSLDESENSRIKNLLNFENDISMDERIEEIKKVLENNLLPDILEINTEEDLLIYLKKRPHLNDIPLVVKKYYKLDLQ